MPKRSLLLIEEDKLKIVYGDKMRCINVSDLALAHNAEFLEKIFKTTTVFKVDKVLAVATEDISGLTQMTTSVTRSSPSIDKPSAIATTTRVLEPSSKTNYPEIPVNSTWIKSNAQTTIIIDDLFTGSQLSRGGTSVPRSVALEPGKPFNLGTLTNELLNASKILPRLLSNGTVSRISFDESMNMLELFEKNQVNIISALDANAKSVTASSDTKARDIVDSMFSEDNPSVIPLEITQGSIVGMSRTSSNEDTGSMSELMDMISDEESIGSLDGNGELKYSGVMKKARIV
jgi:hypothetical protein